METKTNLMLYRNVKINICEERCCRNGEKYTIITKARSNTLELKCRSWGDEEEKICKLCCKEREILTHSLQRCDFLQEYKQEVL